MGFRVRRQDASPNHAVRPFNDLGLVTIELRRGGEVVVAQLVDGAAVEIVHNGEEVVDLNKPVVGGIVDVDLCGAKSSGSRVE